MKRIILLLCLCALQTFFGQKIIGQPGQAQVQSDSMASQHTDAPVYYHIYLPDAYHADTSRSFPVIYWLHGSGGWPTGAINMLANRFHRAIKAEKMPPAMVVFLDDGKTGSMWVDWKDGSLKMESIVIRELIPHIDAAYRSIPEARGRILEGGSMGGYGAARFGFSYPDMFATISMLNPGPMQEVLIPAEVPLVGQAKAQQTLDRVYGGDTTYFRTLSPWQIAEQQADSIRGKLAIRMILGGADPSLPNNKLFSAHLTQLDIKHSLTILEEAGHSPREMFAALGDGYWEFFRRILDGGKE
ncbi:MAG: alpha/beta hydrolase-fold protein [Bacteroidota bacterium]